MRGVDIIADKLVDTSALVPARTLYQAAKALSRSETVSIGRTGDMLALTGDGPRVLEFNARFGDPETQALIPRLDSDLGEVCLAAASSDLEGMKLDWSPRACVSVVLASQGYPGTHRTGLEISGIEQARALEGVHVFHAGTAQDEDGRLVTAGGRVLSVSALGDGFRAARRLAYEAASIIDFEGKHVRHDIGLRAERYEGG
jgi:phosphoribosylamine---glycine ligase